MRFLILFLVTGMMSVSVMAKSIVAVVNDEPISSYDVDQRVELIKLMNPQAASNKTLEKEALEQLITDALKVQEAEKQKFTLSDEEVANAVTRLEQQNQMPVGALEKELDKRGISKRALEKQIRADLMWLHVLRQHKDDVPEIDEKKIQDRIGQMKKELKKERFLVAEIVLNDHTKAYQVLSELKQGAQFDVLAKNQSIGKTAAEGGIVGWVDESRYAPAVIKELRKMQPNQVSDPIQTDDGYYIVLLLDHKKPMSEQVLVWELAQLAVSPAQTIDVLPQLSNLSSCDAFEQWGKQHALSESAKRGYVNTEQLPPKLVDMLKNKKLNTLVGPVSMGAADLFFMKCQEENRSLIPSEDEVRGQLEMEQMMLLTERLMREMKRYAVIEYKE